MNPLLAIRNHEALEETFGAWPSFHDAEVLALRLDRGEPRADRIDRPTPSLEVDIHVFEMTPEVDERGYYRLRNHTRVTIAFHGIDELSLEGFNNQNVLSDLVLTDLSDRPVAPE